jgi:exopolyphosphatase/guanosine-5'-triphosphate,3'-diphosphate pyrophosphatase
MTKRVAAIDCGTNSIRLLIADQYTDEGGTLRIRDVIPRKTRINRLGYGVDKTHQFDTEALERTFTFEREFAQDIKNAEVAIENIRFIATSASRDATNRDEFFTTTKQILGVTPEVISGDEEADLSFAGVVSAFSGVENTSTSNNFLVVDLGGGSTELIVGAKSPEAALSMNIGSVRITERYFADVHEGEQIPTQLVSDAYEYVTKCVHDAINQLDAQLDSEENVVDSIMQIFGVAGTVTTLTAYFLGLDEYSSDAVSGTEISRTDGINICNEFLQKTKAEIRALPFINPGRVDVIQAGALIWKVLLEQFSPNSSVTSEHDILDGIALNI